MKKKKTKLYFRGKIEGIGDSIDVALKVKETVRRSGDSIYQIQLVVDELLKLQKELSNDRTEN